MLTVMWLLPQNMCNLFQKPQSCPSTGLSRVEVTIVHRECTITHLPSQTLLVTVGGFQWAQALIHESWFMHLQQAVDNNNNVLSL